MSILSICIKNSEGVILAESTDKEDVILTYEPTYAEGDCIHLKVEQTNQFYVIQLDDAMAPALVYMTSSDYILEIPFHEQRVSYNTRAFTGERHYLSARIAAPEEIPPCWNLAFNPYDAHGNNSCYPHAFANVETRGESVFAARNAIDGVLANSSHGQYPFQSWGINQNPKAEWTLEFGRDVTVNKLIIYLRADFPHDNWWKKMTVTFSDGSLLVLDTVKTHKGQSFTFEEKTISWLRLSDLIQADDPSPFPALTQLQVFGKECN